MQTTPTSVKSPGARFFYLYSVWRAPTYRTIRAYLPTAFWYPAAIGKLDYGVGCGQSFKACWLFRFSRTVYLSLTSCKCPPLGVTSAAPQFDNIAWLKNR